MILIDKLLQHVVATGSSDLHLTVGRPPTVRLRGRLRSLNTKVLEPDDTVSLMKSIAPERNQQELQEVGSSDFGFAFGDAGRFRVNIFKQKGHVALVLRLIPSKILTFDQIGLPPVVKKMIAQPHGIILVTGPTGSGKTTTLAAMIDYINARTDRHIITVEDPIEYYHNHKKSLINQRELGSDVPSFSEALRRALRQDPDVILVGEMRDLDTIEAAITAAETGHLVFGTLHTTGAAETVNRIIDAFPMGQQAQIRTQLSVALVAVLSQQLLPRANGKGLATMEAKAVAGLAPPPRRLGVLSQTTQVPAYFTMFIKDLVDRTFTKDSELRVTDTICHDIRDRQEAAAKLARKVDLMLVVADRTPTGLKAARRIAELVRELDIVNGKSGLVINRVPERLCNEPPGLETGLPLFGCVPEDPVIEDFELHSEPLLALPAACHALAAVRKILDTMPT